MSECVCKWGFVGVWMRYIFWLGLDEGATVCHSGSLQFKARIKGVDKQDKDVFVCASVCVCLFVCVHFMRSDNVTLILKKQVYTHTNTRLSLCPLIYFLSFSLFSLTHTWFCGVSLIVSQHLSESLGACNDQTSKIFQ